MYVYIVVLVFILFDIVTGLMKAFYNDGLNSTVLRKGLFHKLSEVVAVAGAGLAEVGMRYINLGFEIPMLHSVAIYICLMEFVSIAENISEVNPQLGKFFAPYLAKLKAKQEDKKND